MASIRFEGVTKRFRDGTVAVNDLWLDVPDGEFMILVGPSGCGKTTALRLVAGFEEPTEGRILLDDTAVEGLPPDKRDVAMVFQSYALFPHMTVRENMSFPLRMRGLSRPAQGAAVGETAALLGLSELMDRMPQELSGGQRQRVAMGRAIVRQPRAFLMDEPLSNLDAQLRAQMRAELARLHRRLGVTTLYVTHDQTEAMTLGTRVAVMRHGSVEQVGPPKELYQRPATVFVARFIGSPSMNFLPGVVRDGRLTVSDAVGRSTFDAPADWPREERQVLVGVRPESWRQGVGADDADVTIDGAVELVEEFGAQTIVYFALASEGPGMAVDEEGEAVGTFAACLFGGVDIAAGEAVQFHASLGAVHVFDAGTGRSLMTRITQRT